MQKSLLWRRGDIQFMSWSRTIATDPIGANHTVQLCLNVTSTSGIGHWIRSSRRSHSWRTHWFSTQQTIEKSLEDSLSSRTTLRAIDLLIESFCKYFFRFYSNGKYLCAGWGIVERCPPFGWLLNNRWGPRRLSSQKMNCLIKGSQHVWKTYDLPD